MNISPTNASAGHKLRASNHRVAHDSPPFPLSELPFPPTIMVGTWALRRATVASRVATSSSSARSRRWTSSSRARSIESSFLVLAAAACSDLACHDRREKEGVGEGECEAEIR